MSLVPNASISPCARAQCAHVDDTTATNRGRAIPYIRPHTIARKTSTAITSNEKGTMPIGVFIFFFLFFFRGVSFFFFFWFSSMRRKKNVNLFLEIEPQWKRR
jgi:hypothetical protein